MQRTIFCDVDGVILRQSESFLSGYPDKKFGPVIPKSRETIFKWWCEGHNIILTTGRNECEYEGLKAHLNHWGVFFHKLIMQCGSGPRYLINDTADSYTYSKKATAINIERNVGLDEEYCCLCGKPCSTEENDGGQECELDDGRWTCSSECWDKAVGFHDPDQDNSK